MRAPPELCLRTQYLTGHVSEVRWLRNQVLVDLEGHMSTVQSQTQSLPTGTWQLDPVHSQVGFAVKYMVGTFRGSFSPVAATLSVADGDASLTGEAKAESVKVQEPSLVSHLLSPDFFDTERTPHLRFHSTDVR